jgi:hypothetical protein
LDKVTPHPDSPCIAVCELDAAGVCVGCFRHIDEIGAWSAMSADDQRVVLGRAEARRFNAEQDS